MAKTAKITRLEVNKTINSEGEILEETRAFDLNVGAEPDYIKIYLDNIMFLAELQGWISKVLYKLVKSVNYADKGQIVIVNAGYKRIIAEELGIKPQTVTNAINQLVKKGILIKKESGVFLLNPQYFGKGNWKDISKLRYEVELSREGTRLQLVEIENKEEQEAN